MTGFCTLLSDTQDFCNSECFGVDIEVTVHYFTQICVSPPDKMSHVNKINGLQSYALNHNTINEHATFAKGKNKVHANEVPSSVSATKQETRRQGWNVPVSEMAKNTLNPIRAIVDGMKLTPNPDKPMIALSIGNIHTRQNTLPFWATLYTAMK